MKRIDPTDTTLASLRAHNPQGKMHPDNLPWAKTCRGVRWYGKTINCAYVDDRTDEYTYTSANPFPCWHRTEGGFYRICAGWARAHSPRSRK
jgi:hypothetical protein